jgi:hypothetical protein
MFCFSICNGNISCAHELMKFIKNLKNFTHVLSILLHMCIKFEVKTNYSLSIKKEISTIDQSKNVFLLLLRY